MPKTLFVILDREHIGEVMRGERHELPVIDPAPIGSKVALKVARNRRPTVIVEVTGCERDPEGHTLTVRTIPLEHEPLLLATDSSRGYTDKPFLALSEEPEAIAVDLLSPRWGLRSQKRMQQARTDHESRQRAKALARRAKQAALDDHTLADELEQLLNRKAA
jgi:hypothetical protein